MFSLVNFKLLLKKYKNVFQDILADMTIKEISANIITFADVKGNVMYTEINDNDIVFTNNGKRYTKVTLPSKDEDNDIKVIDIIKEERPNGCIIEVIEKYYGFTKYSSIEKSLVDLISKRYVFDRDIKINDNINLDELCKMKTVFESHFKTLIMLEDSIRWCTDSPYSTETLVNGFDISYIYDIVDGVDKIYRIYDLYNGIINERNSGDIFSIHMGLLKKEGLGYKEINKITAQENEICGNSNNNKIKNQDSTFIYDLINRRVGYKKEFDIYDINSIVNAITHQKTYAETMEEKLDISYEEFDKLDCDEQKRQGQRINNKIYDILYSKPVALIKKISNKL